MANKNINFYYTLSNDDGTVYRNLGKDSDEITETTELDCKHTRNYMMNSNYKATDADLLKFRDDLIRHNEDIKKTFFRNKNKDSFKVDVFNYLTMNDAVYNIATVNSDQKTIAKIPNVDFREFVALQNCLTCGLMTVDKNQLDKPLDCYTYDYPKFYYNMMRKIRIPTSKPEYYVLDELNFDHLDFGIYRVKINCSNKQFWTVFKFNPKNHYLHSTLKAVYKYKDRFDITFELLTPDDEYDYNFVWYEHTVELKILFKNWFKIIDELLKVCDKKNWLLKNYISQIWGNLSTYKKIYVNGEDSDDYDFDHLDRISYKNPYDYYAIEHSNDTYTMINANKPFKHKGLARIKNFLTEYARNYMFNMVCTNNLESFVIRIQTDSVTLTKPVDFTKLNMVYYPIAEAKSTGYIVFHNVNNYKNICLDCGLEYKYCKNAVHECC